MTEQQVDPVASDIATGAAEVLAFHRKHQVVDLGAVMAGRTPPPGPPPPPPEPPTAA